MTPLRVVHVADLHLGFTGPSALVVKDSAEVGRPLRETDIERAVRWLGDSLVNAEPPVDLLLIAGDLFHRANPLPRAVTEAAELVRTLVEAGIDVVIIEGNHDAPVTPLHGSPLAYLRSLGAHVVHGDQPVKIGPGGWRNERLHARVLVHAVPHGALRRSDLSGIQPEGGFVNLLVAHGRVQGDTRVEETRPVNSVPVDLIRKGWSYVALGDAHAHGHQPITDIHARYAGSLEALTFGEGRRHPPAEDDPYALRGAVDVRFGETGTGAISTLPYIAARPLLRLSPLNAHERTAHELLALIEEAVTDLPLEALVQLEIQNCPASLYEQMDHAALRQLEQRTRHLDLKWRLYDNEILQSDCAPKAESLPDQWLDFLTDHVEDETDLAWLQSEGLRRLQEAREALALAEGS